MQHQLRPNQSTEDSHLGDFTHGVAELKQSAFKSISDIVVGLDSVVEQLLLALVAGGHVLMEGVPGTAKTTLCKCFAEFLGIDFQRIQFTPDLLPSDVTGTNIFDRKQNEFVLRKGPIFTHLLLADELNRAPAKTQSSLLEAMQEWQVTIEGTTLELPHPFMVLATQNPVEQEGVYRLPEAQLDRFLLRVDVGYPDRADEVNMLDLHSQPVGQCNQLATVEQVKRIRELVPQIHVSPDVREYIVDIGIASREHADIALGASPRASLYLMHAARAHAILDGRPFVTHADVQAVMIPVLGHRLILRPEVEIEGRLTNDVISDLLTRVPVNTTTKDS